MTDIVDNDDRAAGYEEGWLAGYAGGFSEWLLTAEELSTDQLAITVKGLFAEHKISNSLRRKTRAQRAEINKLIAENAALKQALYFERQTQAAQVWADTNNLQRKP